MPDERPASERDERIGSLAAEQEFESDAGRRGASREQRGEAPSARKEPKTRARQPGKADGGGRSVRRRVRRDRNEPDGGPDEETSDEADGGEGRRSYARARQRNPVIGAASDLSAREAARAAMREISDVLGRQPMGVTAVSPRHDGWLVGVEVVELERLPSSADILALYEAELDMDGTLRSYRRTKRYTRGHGDGGEGR